MTCLELTSTCLDLACLRYDAAMTIRSRRCLQAWIHIEDFLGLCMGRFLENMGNGNGKTCHLHFMLTVWTFTSRIPWNWPETRKPSRPWPSVTIRNHPFTNHPWHLQDVVVKQGMCIMSRASLKFPFCSAFVPGLRGRIFDGHWILESCDLDLQHFFFQHAWFCIWDASNGFFEVVLMVCDMWRVSNVSLYHDDGPNNLAGKPTRQTLWSQKRHPGMHKVERSPEIKVVFAQCCYSMLLRLLTVTCHLQRPGPAGGGSTFDFGTHQNRPKPIRIPDSRKGFQWQLSLTLESSLQFSVRQVHPKTSRRWWLRARFRSTRLFHCSLCISYFRKISKRTR